LVGLLRARTAVSFKFAERFVNPNLKF